MAESPPPGYRLEHLRTESYEVNDGQNFARGKRIIYVVVHESCGAVVWNTEADIAAHSRSHVLGRIGLGLG